MPFLRKDVVLPIVNAVRPSKEDAEATKTQIERKALARKLVSRTRSVSSYWSEKALLIIDAFQVFGLAWQLSQPWPWPSRWLRRTHWVMIFNLDFLAYFPSGAGMGSTSVPFSLWGQLDGYLWYAALFAFLPVIVVCQYLIRRHRIQKVDPEVRLRRRAALRIQTIQLLQVIYLPVLLAVGRLWNCNLDGNLSVDPSVVCWDIPHSVLFGLLTCTIGGIYAIGFPILLHYNIKRYIIFKEKDAHERFVRSKELEYILGTSQEYLHLNIPLHSSYTRRAIHFPVLICIYKLVLWGIFCFLRTPRPAKSLDSFQGTLFFFIYLGFATYSSLKMPYRIRSSYQLLLLVQWTLVFNGIYVLMCSHGVRSALTVASSVSLALSFVNTISSIYLGYLIVQQYKDWILWYQGRLANTKDGWPTHTMMDDVVEHVFEVENWVKAILDAKYVLVKAFFVPPEFKPVNELEEHLNTIEKYAAEAALVDHLLYEQLFRLVQELTDAHNSASATSLLPFPELEESTPQLRKVMDDRCRSQMFMSPNKKSMLAKLLALRTWEGERKIDYINLNDEGALDQMVEPSSFEDSSGNDFINLAQSRFNTLKAAKKWKKDTSSVPAYSLAFLKSLEWGHSKLYTVCDVEDWILTEWLISLKDDIKNLWITVTAIEYSKSERILKVKVPNRLQIGAEAYFIGFVPLSDFNDMRLKLVKCLDFETQELFGEVKFEIEREGQYRKHCSHLEYIQEQEDERKHEKNSKIRQLIQLTSDVLNDQDATLDAVESCKAKWKDVIRLWEDEFQQEHGRRPTSQDKSTIRFWYEQYQLVRKRIKQIQMA